MKPIELLKERYIEYLNTNTILDTMIFHKYRAVRSFTIQGNILTLEDIQSMETKALIEWESSLNN